ncbi:MAG: hypothetical protein BRC31_06735 [Actinobacteria bacterium QS_5_72_10]|nr:MAG: hypothetical protein BRC31_06735 [Actinobacteria bacterium QS_5_72_10]
MSIALIVAIVVVVLLIAWVALSYNRLVKKATRADSDWANIDTQLRRRADLIPNLVETVKGYASHEEGTLTQVIQARSRAQQAQQGAGDRGERQAAEQEVGQALVNINALTEQYPDLKADQNFRQLQDELSSTEDKIAFSRQRYNDAVRAYESTRRRFPAVILARQFGFDERDYFDEVTEEQRQAPEVNF